LSAGCNGSNGEGEVDLERVPEKWCDSGMPANADVGKRGGSYMLRESGRDVARLETAGDVERCINLDARGAPRVRPRRVV